MRGLDKIKCLLAVEVYEISEKYISSLRLAHRNANEVFDILPEFTINTNEGANNEPILAKYFHQFMGYDENDEKKYLYFNLSTVDNQLDFELNETTAEDLFKEFNFKKMLSNFTPLLDDSLEKYVVAPTNYLVVELTYMLTQDYYSGGWEGDMDVDIIGYLDEKLNVIEFKDETNEL